MRTLLFYFALTGILPGCGRGVGNYDVTTDRHVGTEARTRIERLRGSNSKQLPTSARNFYLFDGGTFNGSITYASFNCDSVEDCFAAITFLGGPEKDEFTEWVPSQYAVVMNGPGFYSRELASDRWNVRDIKNGVVYEQMKNKHRTLTYCAIDLDRKCVYYHWESGGFPSDVYLAKPQK